MTWPPTGNTTDLERRINAVFEHYAESALLGDELAEDDFQWRETCAFLGDLAGRKVLDVGCGKGRFLSALAFQGADAIGMEPAGALAEAARAKGHKVVRASASRMPFADGTFDACICIEVLEHVPDTDAAVREMARVLRRGGRLLVIDKNAFALHPRWLVPWALVKRVKELSGRWMYPAGFPFREIWFNPARLAGKIGRHFRHVEVKYLERAHAVHGPFSEALLHRFPFFSFYVAWRAVK